MSNYDAEPLLRSCGISISSNFTQVEGRVLPAPKVWYSYLVLTWIIVLNVLFVFFAAENGTWRWTVSEKWSLEFQQQGAVSCLSLFVFTFSCKKDVLIPSFLLLQQFVEPTKIDKWAVANFSARCNVRQLVDDLIRIGGMKGIVSMILFSSCFLETCFVIIIITICIKLLSVTGNCCPIWCVWGGSSVSPCSSYDSCREDVWRDPV